MMLTRRVFNGAVLAGVAGRPPGRSRPHWPAPRFHFRRRRSRRRRPPAARSWSKSMPIGARPARRRSPILDKLTADPKFKDLKIFRVDFDAMKPVVKQFGAQMQSTLIVFKGAAEQGRSVGDTRAGFDRSPARQEPLSVIRGDHARAGLRGRTAVDPVALRAAAGADRARRGGCRASARRGRVGRWSFAVVHGAWPVARAGWLRARHRCRHVPPCGRRDHGRAWRDPAGAVMAGAARGGRRSDFRLGRSALRRRRIVGTGRTVRDRPVAWRGVVALRRPDARRGVAVGLAGTAICRRSR